MNRRSTTTVSCVVLVAALTSCGADGSAEPGRLPTKLDTSTTTATPTLVAPTLPAAAQGRGDNAVAGFARTYIAALNHATWTGDTVTVRKWSAQKCVSCRDIADYLDGLYKAGGSIESDGWLVQAIRVAPNQPSRRKFVTMTIEHSPQRVTESSSAAPTLQEGERSTVTMTARSTKMGWQVTGMKTAS